MIWHLLAVFIMAICGGGLAFGLRKLSRNRLPKWLIPAFAAAGMFGYLAYYDYAWDDFKRSQLPDGTTVISEQRAPSFFRPWSYVFPSVSAFTILDGKFSERTQDQQRLVEYFEYTFRQDPIEGLDTRGVVLNCQAAERARFDPARGRNLGPVERIDRDDPVYRKLCR